ncbi:hypothetical protein GCM10007416_03380 [Kroppenstedtia guangzhouensis]|uniref:DUF819 family protein n=1 Tax=Kroppenstedtia guangzhouensis TaxID=1274356 RepID=A0ABQ1FZX4_9BACL|nr:DUF819 family protein [Kroppenstedtia guangzhouensis]GGA33968.1 hypothetical protein GCM10007416_03380 [Kroppenstedtia guangzhouensis]
MTSEALVTSPFGVGAVITSLIAISFWLDRRFRFFSWLGTAILVITGGAVLVNLGVIPSAVGGEELNPVYIFASDYGVPLAIVLLLLATDFSQVRSLGRPALVAFMLGAIGTAVGAVVGVWLTAGGIGGEAWKLGGQFAASYIGGGINYAAVGNALGTSETMFATGAAADNIMTNIWMVMTAILPVILIRWYPSIRNRVDSAKQRGTAFWNRRELVIQDLILLFAISFTVVAVAEAITPWIDGWVGFEIPPVIWYTTLALLLALFTPVKRLKGGEEVGNFILHFFFATMGAGTILGTLVDKGPVVFLFISIVVGVHGLVIFGMGRIFKVEVEMLAVASQACVGGPSTALALASSKGWTSLVTPAVLLGVLGYAVGNYVGILMGQWIHWLLGSG